MLKALPMRLTLLSPGPGAAMQGEAHRRGGGRWGSAWLRSSAIATAVGLLWGCGPAQESAISRFEVALRVQAGNETYVGSGVWELSIQSRHQVLPGGVPYERTVRGEAILLKSEKGNRLLALKRQGPLADLTYSPLIIQCLPEWSGTLDMMRQLRSFEGGCDVSHMAPEIIEIPSQSSSGISRLPYSDAPNAGATRTISSVTVAVRTTEKPITIGVTDTVPIDFLRKLEAIQSTGSIVRNQYYLEDFTTEVSF